MSTVHSCQSLLIPTRYLALCLHARAEMIKHHLLETYYCQTVSSIQSIFGRKASYVPLCERAEVNILSLDPLASQGGAGLRHSCDTRAIAAFPFMLNGLFYLPGLRPTSECRASILWQAQSSNSPSFVTSSLLRASFCSQ